MYVEYFLIICVKKSVENVEKSIFSIYINKLTVEKSVDFLFIIFFIKKWFIFSTISIILIVTILIMGELQDLGKLAIDLVNEYQTMYNGKEIELPNDFKNQVKEKCYGFEP